MARVPNKYGGGAQTNANGLLFEQTTSLDVALEDAGYGVIGHKVYDGKNLIGFSVQKNSLYSVFLEPNGIYYSDYNSKKWLPWSMKNYLIRWGSLLSICMCLMIGS